MPYRLRQSPGAEGTCAPQSRAIDHVFNHAISHASLALHLALRNCLTWLEKGVRAVEGRKILHIKLARVRRPLSLIYDGCTTPVREREEGGLWRRNGDGYTDRPKFSNDRIRKGSDRGRCRWSSCMTLVGFEWVELRLAQSAILVWRSLFVVLLDWVESGDSLAWPVSTPVSGHSPWLLMAHLNFVMVCSELLPRVERSEH